MFERSGGTWRQVAYLKASNPGNSDAFGSAVGLSGGTVVMGAPSESSAGTGMNADQTDDSKQRAGAVYVFNSSDLWTDLGGGTAGLLGQPELSGTGTLTGGLQAGLALSNAPPRSMAVLWLSLAPMTAPALNGTVHALPYTTQFQLITDDTGSVSGSGTWPNNFPPCTSAWFQCVVQDPSVIWGLTLSNGLRATTP